MRSDNFTISIQHRARKLGSAVVTWVKCAC